MIKLATFRAVASWKGTGLNLTSHTLQTRLPLIFIVVGIGAITLALSADLLGIGHSESFGEKQFYLTVVGSLLVFCGIVGIVPLSRRYLSDWRNVIRQDQSDPGLAVIGAGYGLLVGIIKVSTLVDTRLVEQRWINRSQDFIWLVPLSEVLCFIFLVLVIRLLQRFLPRLISRRVSVFILSFEAFASLLMLIPQLAYYSILIVAAGLAFQVAWLSSVRPQPFHRLLTYFVGWPIFLGRPGGHPVSQDSAVRATRRPSRREFLLGSALPIAALAVGREAWTAGAETRTLAALPKLSPSQPNILLVVLDTVRAKSLGLFGYSRQTSPWLDKFAKNAVFFDHAFSAAPWTLPSHASMFTGRYPHELSTSLSTPLDTTYPTLSEILTSRGYATAGFVGNTAYCGYESGLNRGFTHFEDYTVSVEQFVLDTLLLAVPTPQSALWSIRTSLGHPDRDAVADCIRNTAEMLNNRFLSWLDTHHSQPFFAFLNYFDAHDPYRPPADFALRFESKASNGIIPYNELPSPDVLAELNEAYDGCIAYDDYHLGVLMEELGRRGALDDTLVIVVSDHGEQFGEHNLTLHINSLYMPLIHVPLLMSHPNILPAGKVISAPASLRDLPSTILDLVGLNRASPIPGQSLRRHWSANTQTAGPQSEMLLSEVERVYQFPPWYPAMKGPMKSLVSNNFHYIKNLGDGREELYDYEKDPEEVDELSRLADSRPVLDRFRTALDDVTSGRNQSS